MKKICVVSGARSEYGQLRWLMENIRAEKEFLLQLVVTGMHLSPEFDLTYKEIERDGFRIDKNIEILLSSDSSVGIAKSIGLGVMGFGEAFQELRPDLVILLGDRFEILAAATAAMIAGLPIAHLHGGEITEGVLDDSIRHAITKMAHLHFVAAESYRRRVVQMGESPDCVFVSGGLGVDAIQKTPLLDRRTLESSLKFKFGKRNLLVTFHPVTLAKDGGAAQMEELLAALDTLKEVQLIITLPNADTGGRTLIRMVEKFVATHPNAKAFTSLGQQRYLSCIAHVDAVVGNSSSGLSEAPSFKKASVNIGERQKGRLRAASVIDCAPLRGDILAAVEKLYTPAFQATLEAVRNPYGEGGASKIIVETIKKIDTRSIQKKGFHDLPSSTDAEGCPN